MPQPKPSHRRVHAVALAMGLAAGGAPALASQPTEAGCNPSPVIGRDGAVLYVTVRSGCAGDIIDTSSDTAGRAADGQGSRRSHNPAAAAVVPVSGVAVETPVMR
jgi:hypothetical protein